MTPGPCRYRLLVPTKPVNWSVEWSAVEDSKLLVGVYEHGLGNWESIKGDSKLGLGQKVLSMALSICLSVYLYVCLNVCLSNCLSVCLSVTCHLYHVSPRSTQILSPNRSHKPQSSHLQTRVEYLLKVLEKTQKKPSKKVCASILVVAYHCTLLKDYSVRYRLMTHLFQHTSPDTPLPTYLT